MSCPCVEDCGLIWHHKSLHYNKEFMLLSVTSERGIFEKCDDVLQRNFHGVPVPHRTTILNLVKKFRVTGSVLNKSGKKNGEIKYTKTIRTPSVS